MFPKATLTQKEVVPLDKKGNPNPDFPQNHRCKSGHTVPPGTRFFQITGPALPKEHWGTYCEPCLKVANTLAQKQKQHLQDT